MVGYKEFLSFPHSAECPHSQLDDWQAGVGCVGGEGEGEGVRTSRRGGEEGREGRKRGGTMLCFPLEKVVSVGRSCVYLC
mmetsp:Transcript_8825/g.17269  ORF Transcript_8825/g.17269 Transcript_8825/m.17269 type:complete len:80 (-) Transcript_8825:24-263(-)